jgi:hypothetical protein
MLHRGKKSNMRIFCFTINLTRTALESNPDHHDETPVTKGGDVQ